MQYVYYHYNYLQCHFSHSGKLQIKLKDNIFQWFSYNLSRSFNKSEAVANSKI